jgi:glycine reductase complex component B subunit gamma
VAIVRVVHYLNQFFAGVGGEEKADVGPNSADKPVGPAIGIAQVLGHAGQVVGTVWCGDNYMAVNGAAAVDEVVGLISEFKADVVVAGPSFASGRYGLACAELCVSVQERLGIPAIAAMHAEAPAAEEFRKKTIIVASTEKALGMAKVLPVLARVALKVARGEPLGPPAEEGYLAQGIRKNEFASQRGSARAVAMVAERLRGKVVETELPLPKYRQVPAPPALPADAPPLVALVTEAGLVPKGNPERMPAGWCRVWAKYDVAGVQDLTSDTFEIVHGGFDTSASNEDPDRQVPLDVLRELEEEGTVRAYDGLYATCGNMGSMGEMQRIGLEMAEDMRKVGVEAAIVGST